MGTSNPNVVNASRLSVFENEYMAIRPSYFRRSLPKHEAFQIPTRRKRGVSWKLDDCPMPEADTCPTRSFGFDELGSCLKAHAGAGLPGQRSRRCGRSLELRASRIDFRKAARAFLPAKPSGSDDAKKIMTH
jgi:hypothetical protein